MKKIFVPLLAMIALASCSISVKPTDSRITEVIQSISYAEDKKTGLCFAITSSQTSSGYIASSIACVPCDSLKNVSVTEIKK